METENKPSERNRKSCMERITFCINTSCNERPYLELMLASLYNAIDTKLHEVIVFADSDNQGSAEMVSNQRELFPNLTVIKNNGTPIFNGPGINYMLSKAKTPVVASLQSDMVVGLNYDKAILSHLTEGMILSSTRIEPPLHALSDNAVTYVKNMGLSPEEFNYNDFINFSESIKDPNKLTNHYFSPFCCYKKTWDAIGGHDVNFHKSREDSDLAIRCCLNKYRLVQCWDAIVYHFTCTSSRGIEWWKPENQERDKIRRENDRIELARFEKKWGEFCHPTKYEDVEIFLQMNPSMLDKVVVKNPPIDETKLTIL